VEYRGPIAPWNPGERSTSIQLRRPVKKGTGSGSVREISIRTDVEKGRREGQVSISSVVPSDSVTVSRTISIEGSKPQGGPLTTSTKYAEKFTDPKSGKSQENAATVTHARGDGVKLEAGHVTTQADGKRETEGVVVRRDPMGEVSGQVVHDGGSRERKVDFGPPTKDRPSIGARLKGAVFGRKLGRDSLESTLPEAR
jgi:hypothetical protein